MGYVIFLVLGLVAHAYADGGVKSGLSVRFSQRGLSYIAHRIVDPYLRKEAVGIVLPKSLPLNISAFAVRLVNSSITSLFLHNADVAPSAQLKALVVRKRVDLSGTSQYYAQQSSWPHISDHGTIRYNLTGLNVSVSLALRPGKSGLWNMTLISSQVSVSDFQLTFLHSTFPKSVLNLLTKLFKSEIIQHFRTTVEDVLPVGLSYVNYELSLHLPYVAFMDGFGANLSLTSGGVWKSACLMDVQTLGAILYDHHPYGTMSTADVPEPACQGPMVTAVISSSVLHSALLALTQPRPKFTYSVHTGLRLNNSMLPIVFPEISRHQAPGTIVANISLAQGSVDLGVDSFNVAGTIFIDMILLTPLGTEELLATLSLALHGGAGIAVRDLVHPVNGSHQALALNDLSLSIDSLGVRQSKIGEIKTMVVLDLLKAAVIQHLPDMRARAKQGVPIPSTSLNISNVSLKTNTTYIEVACDVLGDALEAAPQPTHPGSEGTTPEDLPSAVSYAALGKAVEVHLRTLLEKGAKHVLQRPPA